MRRTTRRRLFLVFVALGALAAGGEVARRTLLRPPPAAPRAGTQNVYQCSMHPQIVAHEPGICPICQMQLQRVDDAHGAAAPAARTPRFYRHPMRPDVTSPTPAKNEMGMDYVPVYEEDVVPSAGSDVPGHAPFTLSTERQQLIGVTRGRVERRDLATEIRAAGRVAYDPELYQAIVEYREAVRARAELAKSPWPDARRGADAIVRSAALRLRQRGVSEAQLGAIAPAGGDPLNLLLPGKSVWVYAQVYEYELDLVRPGERVTVTAPSTPHQTYTGTVVAIDPVLDPATRTARVRVLLPTPDANLRPETFVQARIDVPLGRVLAVPEGAVLDTGEHRIVFVVADEGRFEPRSVTLGREAQGYWEVLAGLEEGEEVVTSANFLIDSESRFRAALAAFGKAPAGGHAH